MSKTRKHSSAYQLAIPGAAASHAEAARAEQQLNELKLAVLEANRLLPESHLVVETQGNASGIARELGLVAIKPSGLPYDKIGVGDMVVVALEDGRVVDGQHAPSTDLCTHLELYRAWPEIGGVVHTHSQWATVSAVAGLDLLPYSTDHADYFRGAVPCTRQIATEEIIADYEAQVGRLIVARFAGLNHQQIPAVLVHSHGPFTWGATPRQAVEHAVALERVSCLTRHALALTPLLPTLPQPLVDKHYLRKHGPHAYYGQNRSPLAPQTAEEDWVM